MDKAVKKIICLTPVYNDWKSFSMLAMRIEEEFKGLKDNYAVEIIAINDGSFDDTDITPNLAEIQVEVVVLKNNVGHQRAIAIGLQYINNEKTDLDIVIVLDCDGEDDPKDIVKLLSASADHHHNKIIFAQRKKRQESLLFKIGYFFYKYLHYWLTGQKMNFGNFSCIPKKLLKRIVVMENLWIHFSGSIIQSKMPFDKIPLTRGKRYSGQSKMNFTKLILHGLSSISVYFDFLSVRILKLSLLGLVTGVLAVGAVLYIKLFTALAVPGWASNLILLIFSIIIQLSSITLIILLMQLSSRKNIKSPSSELYKDFVDSVNLISGTNSSTDTK